MEEIRLEVWLASGSRVEKSIKESIEEFIVVIPGGSPISYLPHMIPMPKENTNWYEKKNTVWKSPYIFVLKKK